MSKFVLNLYQLKINEHIRSKLTNDLDTHTYLRTLFDLYSKQVYQFLHLWATTTTTTLLF